MSFIDMDKRYKISKMLIDLNILFLIALMISVQNGSNASGFDSATSCSPNNKQSRRGRAQMLAAIPCDLTQQAYCNLPGAVYPWHAVRRFVHENQGLMKRMYGDVRHISVLRDEITNNQIDIEDIESTAERYSRDGGVRRSSKYMRQRDESFAGGGGGGGDDDFIMDPTTGRAHSTRNTDAKAFNDNDGTTMRNKFEEIKGETTQETEEKFKNNNVVSSEAGETKSKERIQTNEQSNAIKNKNENPHIHDDRNLASNSVFELPTLIANEIVSQPMSGDNIEVIDSPKLDIELKNMTQQASIVLASSKTNKPTISPPTSVSTPFPTTISDTTKSSSLQPTSPKPQSFSTTTTTITTTTTKSITTKKPSTVSHISSYRRQPQYSNRYRPHQSQQRLQLQQQQQHQKIYKINITKESLTAMNLKQKPNESERTTATTITTKPQFLTETNLATINDVESSPTPSSSSTSSSSSGSNSITKAKFELFSSEKFRKQPTTTTAGKPPTPSTLLSSTPSAHTTKAPLLRDGQLYQDTVKQDPAPNINLKGVNACPVKEEVVAPFWANNTRGEVLALLNLYPFEQYVHWEKCTHEHKQMYCRDGCRCEQQYRLHRLLAYDPHNECRGIFSDWFRFPSCCICKCYNIPIDFRATSRSPRMQSFPNAEDDIGNDTEDQRHPLEIAEEEVQRAIYEHATEEWYRPRDDYDYNDYFN